jgi:membrane protein required for colicin V production
MNWLDIIIAILLVASLVIGFMQGFIKTLLTLVGLVVGIVLASNFYQELGGLLKFISDPRIANILAFIIILLVVSIAAAILAMILKTILKAINLGCVDRFAGAVLGFFIATFLISAILAGAVKFFGESLVTGSWFAGVFLDKFPLILGLLPKEFDQIRGFFK